MSDSEKIADWQKAIDDGYAEWRKRETMRNAASEMLEALKAAVSQVHLTNRTEPMSPEVQRVFDQCCAAIAKAEGRS